MPDDNWKGINEETKLINWKLHAGIMVILLISFYYIVDLLRVNGYIDIWQEVTANISLNSVALVYAVYMTKMVADEQRHTRKNPIYLFMVELRDELGTEMENPNERRQYVKGVAKILRSQKDRIKQAARSPDGSVEEVLKGDGAESVKCPALSDYLKKERIRRLRNGGV